MKRGYVKSSPHFFRLIKAALALTVLALMALAALVPAPLQEQANLARVPNPVKSAWFLLWIQELVSYSKYLIYLVLALAACFLALPWLSRTTPPDSARWLPRECRAVNGAALAASVLVLALTLVALFCRGANWQFVPHF
ncbi:selenite/tellurite reduction operon b-type cytochrome membrane protein ExtQ [Geomonas azotofigens]|uniref:selenite/tellurite reduction operon b-type cytochrome membrane protein ExtQ n=1 Tax=Geomonas azotofigens TaxID=2843196 RepID=UPI001C112A48|nr:selenite/tellurite reduction operon b-type cytochrome membrane protein ExtQ [Geomonas azotofigens]MBU5611782.1 cytochrome B6 [Geomonas azotofigens]